MVRGKKGKLRIICLAISPISGHYLPYGVDIVDVYFRNKLDDGRRVRIAVATFDLETIHSVLEASSVVMKKNANHISFISKGRSKSDCLKMK